MQIISADLTRKIDLPGVGPCPRPVDIDQLVTGFTRLKSLRIYRFLTGATIAGDSEGDEVYVLPFGGAVQMQIAGRTPLDVTLSQTAGPHALYMAPDHNYRLTPIAEAFVAYVRAAATGRVDCHPVEGRSDANAEALSFVLSDLSVGDDLPTDSNKERLIHILSGSVVISGQTLIETQTAALSIGQIGSVRAVDFATVLIISA